MDFVVRLATLSDLDAIYRIWSEGVHTSLGSLKICDRAHRAYFQQRLETPSDVFKFFVVTSAVGDVVSWQSLSKFRSNPIVAGSMAELSSYTSAKAGPGRPTLLGLEHTLRFADDSDLQYVVAFVSGSNVGALKLASRIGMQRVGDFPEARKGSPQPRLAYLVYPCRQDQRRD